MKLTNIIEQDILNAIKHRIEGLLGSPSVQDIMKITGYGRDKIRRGMNKLEGEGFLKRSIGQWRRDSYEVISFEYTGVRHEQ